MLENVVSSYVAMYPRRKGKQIWEENLQSTIALEYMTKINFINTVWLDTIWYMSHRDTWYDMFKQTTTNPTEI